MVIVMTQGNMELFKMKANLCKTFADPKRLFIIDELRSGEKAVGELVKSTGISQAVVSRQLAILRERGVVTPRREGTNVFYSLSDSRIGDACDLVREILIGQLKKNRELTRKLVS
jgi:DNA-binding transcriptional ArsR family regulator